MCTQPCCSSQTIEKAVGGYAGGQAGEVTNTNFVSLAARVLSVKMKHFAWSPWFERRTFLRVSPATAVPTASRGLDWEALKAGRGCVVSVSASSVRRPLEHKK